MRINRKVKRTPKKEAQQDLLNSVNQAKIELEDLKKDKDVSLSDIKKIEQEKEELDSSFSELQIKVSGLKKTYNNFVNEIADLQRIKDVHLEESDIVKELIVTDEVFRKEKLEKYLKQEENINGKIQIVTNKLDRLLKDKDAIERKGIDLREVQAKDLKEHESILDKISKTVKTLKQFEDDIEKNIVTLTKDRETIKEDTKKLEDKKAIANSEHSMAVESVGKIKVELDSIEKEQRLKTKELDETKERLLINDDRIKGLDSQEKRIDKKFKRAGIK